ncbi:uncharacterized protein METZ01_LOCUS190058 [marine metagenome]|uniref:Uncharacterized protein n=1 Tax=marine metagenome TaxID=408172 RepID=A0A382DGT5_9ZZZZ
MSKFFNNNYGKILKKLPSTSSLQSSKSLVTLGLLIYWGVILVGTFFNFN